MGNVKSKTIAGNTITIKKNLVVPRSEVKTDEVVEEAVAKQVAGMLIMGMPNAQIAEELGLTPANVRAIKASYTCRKYVVEIGENALAGVKANIQKEIASRVGKAFKVIDHHLDNNTLKAAEHVFRMAGVLEPAAEADSAQGNLTIYMPGAQQPVKVVSDFIVEKSTNDTDDTTA